MRGKISNLALNQILHDGLDVMVENAELRRYEAENQGFVAVSHAWSKQEFNEELGDITSALQRRPLPLVYRLPDDVLGCVIVGCTRDFDNAATGIF